MQMLPLMLLLPILKKIIMLFQFLKSSFPEITKELWNGELWNPSYYVETIGSISEEAIRQYIQNQEKE